MRLLVLGGTAWLGSAVAEAAIARGHEVVCLARGESGSVPEGATLVRGDRSSSAGYSALEGEFDAVVDVARDPAHVRSATRALADRVGHWVFVSTCSVYADEATPDQDETAAVRAAMPEGVEWSMAQYGEAKVACEQHLRAAVGERLLITRPGLLGGPGDSSGRTGYWPLRFAHPVNDDGTVLVPDEPDLMTQQLDVRDLAVWLIDGAEARLSTVVDAVGEAIPLPDHLALARRVAGYRGSVARRTPDWLREHGVQYWAGPTSLPLWLPLPDYAGFSSRSGARAVGLGLRRRPLIETLTDVLAWEMEAGPGRPRGAGLTADEERRLLAGD